MKIINYYETQEGIDGIKELINRPPRTTNKEIIDCGIPLSCEILSPSDFESWIKKVNYPFNYPNYYNSFIRAYKNLNCDKPEKSIYAKYYEQFIAGLLIEKHGFKSVIDIAADRCPMSAISVDLLGVDIAYAQDLSSLPKECPYLNSNPKIKPLQCNATELPIPANSIDFAFLLNSWEHFQAPSDLKVLHESSRILRKGGKLLIVPLHLNKEAYVDTDMSVWSNKQVYKPGILPHFRKEIPILKTKNKQVYAQYHSLDMLQSFIHELPQMNFEIKLYNCDYDTKMSMYALVATKL